MNTYDHNNVFAKIIKGDLPAKKVYEDTKILAFHDINPRANIHILVIPKNACIDFTDFLKNTNSIEIANFFQTVHIIINQLGIKNYNIQINNGAKAGQEIFHFHLHILSNDEF